MAYKKGSVLSTAFELYTIQQQKLSSTGGDVYEVLDSAGATRILKVLKGEEAAAGGLRRSANDFNFCFKGSHKNIVPLLDCGLTGSKAPFYVMPRYAQSLRDCIRRGLREDEVLPIFGKILDGVEAAHLHGIWHLDLKPENILLDETMQEVVVADFGIAAFHRKALWQAADDSADRLAAYPYAAPEQRQRGLSLSDKTDIYTLGLILNEMFTGKVPDSWNQPTIEEFARNYAYLDWLVGRMTKPDPEQRSSITAVKRELIARGIEFLSIQRLNSLKNEIILETEVDDPLIRNPIGIQAVDFKSETLFLTLSVAPPSNWVAAFHGLHPRATFTGFGPERFVFVGRIAQIGVARTADPQQMLDHAKTYVDAANRIYAEETRAAHRNHLEQEREQRMARIAAEERRQQVLSRLRL